MSDDPTRGSFVWHDLMTGDTDAAIDFYTAVAGWGTQAWEGSDIPYTMWTVGEVPIGGIIPIPEDEEIPPHWLAYIGSPDVDDTAERARELGGEVMHDPQDIPDAGRFTVLRDPQGAVFAVFTPLEAPPAAAGDAEEPGRFSWHELTTTDHQAAFGFYAELFGWEKTDAMDMGEMGTYQMYGHGERTYGGMYDQPEEASGPPAWLHYIRVPDVEAGAERVKELGGQVLNGPMEVPGGDLIAQCLDPQGAAFAIHSTGS